MSMPLEHRLQILIDDERHRRITALARERGVSVATVVREAIDRGLGAADDKRQRTQRSQSTQRSHQGHGLHSLRYARIRRMT